MLFGGNLLKQPAYSGIRYRTTSRLKYTDIVMDRLFWIGVYPGLDPDMLGYIENTMDDFFRQYNVREEPV